MKNNIVVVWQSMSRRNLDVLILLILTFLIFGKSVGFEFIAMPGHDDSMNLLGNRYLGQPGGFSRFWSAPYEQLYIPVVYSFWHVIALLQGSPSAEALRPAPFHALNLVIHLLNGFLVFRLFLQARLPRAVCLVGAALFLLHPLQVEPVVWVTGLKDLLMACFALASLWCYVQAFQTKGKNQNQFLAACYMLFLLSGLCKPTVIVLPIAFLIWGAWVNGIPLRRQWPALVPGIALSALIGWWTFSAQSGLWVPPYRNKTDGAFIALDTIFYSMSKWVFPAELTLDNGRTPARVLARTFTYYGLPALLAVAALASWRLRKFAAVGALFFAASFLLPVSGLRPFLQQVYSSYADRYQYLPMVGFSFFIAWGIYHLSRKQQTGALILATLVLGLATHRTVSTIPNWRDAEFLAEHCLKVRPEGWFGNRTMADIQSNRQNFQEATRHAVAAIRDMEPRNRWLGYLQIAGFLRQQGRDELAEQSENQGRRMLADFLVAQADYLMERSRFSQAQLRYRKILELVPDDERAQSGLNRIPAGTPEIFAEDTSGVIH